MPIAPEVATIAVLMLAVMLFSYLHHCRLLRIIERLCEENERLSRRVGVYELARAGSERTHYLAGIQALARADEQPPPTYSKPDPKAGVKISERYGA